MNAKIKRPLLAATIFGTLAVGAGRVHAAEAPDYSGDLMTRSTLTGDWGGERGELARKGVTFDLSSTQVYQGVVDGGVDKGAELGGRADFILDLDTGKLGLWPGGILQVEVEGNYGEGVNRNTGALMPANTNQVFPVPGETQFAIPSVTYTQFFSKNVGVQVGKLQPIAADTNAFADGKGDIQFMNLAMNIVPLPLFTVPYTPLGITGIILPTGNPAEAVVVVSAFTSTGKADAAGWDTIKADNTTLWSEGRMKTDFFGMTGHQLLAVVYSTKEFKSIDQRISPDETSELVATKDGSWSAYYNFDQFLYEPVKGSGRGFGIFGRLGVADGNPNFLERFYSLGVSGKGMIASRPDDVFGIGGYVIDINNPELQTPDGTISFLRNEYGIEAYYDIAVTPWAHLTPDIQYARGALRHPIDDRTVGIDNPLTMGLRLRLIF
jgi:porin